MVDDVRHFVRIDTGVILLDFIEHGLAFGTYGIIRVLAIVDIEVAAPGNGECGRIVGRTAHLVGVPVGLQVRKVADAGIGTVTLNFLVVPQGEGVVVTVGKDDGVAFLGQRVQVVESEVAASVTAGTVVVVPRLAHHLQRSDTPNTEATPAASLGD